MDPDTRQFYENFNIFVDSITDVSNTSSEYMQRPGETFARFIDRFVAWTQEIATGRRGYDGDSIAYNDHFTNTQFIEFARLLQEKSAVSGATVSARVENVRFSVEDEDIDLDRDFDIELRENQEVSPTRQYVAAAERIEAKALRSRLNNAFYIPTESRNDIRAKVNTLMSRIESGSVTETHLKETFEDLFDAGRVEIDGYTVEPGYTEAHDFMRGKKIYVSDSVKAEFAGYTNARAEVCTLETSVRTSGHKE